MSYFESEPIDRGNRRYIAATMEAPFLEREHEFELARRWRNEGDTEAMRELVLAYARFVVRIATGFRGYGLPLGDLVQEGNIGLMEAAKRFDPERHVRFSTYAAWWVVAAIQEFILRHSSVVRIGTTAAQKSLFFNLRRLRARLAKKPDGDMTDEDRACIAAELGVPLAAVERMEAHITRRDRSLNAHVGEGDDAFQDFLADDAPGPEAIATAHHDEDRRSDWLAQAMARLSERERQIVSRRFLDDDPDTLAELGVVFGVSKERIRQIEAKALEKLRRALTGVAGERAEYFTD